MNRKMLVITCIALASCLALATIAMAADETGGSKAKSFWRKLFSYPASVTKESAAVVANTGTRSVDVVAKEVKTVGEVTSGDVGKTHELITEPIKGTAETAVKAVEETVQVPVEAAKDEPAAAAAVPQETK